MHLSKKLCSRILSAAARLVVAGGMSLPLSAAASGNIPELLLPEGYCLRGYTHDFDKAVNARISTAKAVSTSHTPNRTIASFYHCSDLAALRDGAIARAPAWGSVEVLVTADEKPKTVTQSVASMFRGQPRPPSGLFRENMNNANKLATKAGLGFTISDLADITIQYSAKYDQGLIGADVSFSEENAEPYLVRVRSVTSLVKQVPVTVTLFEKQNTVTDAELLELAHEVVALNRRYFLSLSTHGF